MIHSALVMDRSEVVEDGPLIRLGDLAVMISSKGSAGCRNDEDMNRGRTAPAGVRIWEHPIPKAESSKQINKESHDYPSSDEWSMQ